MHDEIWSAVDRERVALAELVAGLPAESWYARSLCGEWRVIDVVAHVALSARATLGLLAVSMIRARGNFSRMSRDTAIRLADASTPESLTRALRGAVGSRRTPVGTTPTDRLMDLLVHGQDIAVPLGLDHPMPPGAALVSLRRIWAGGWPFHARRRLAGVRLVATDVEWAAGQGPEVRGPVSALLLLATGRPAALDFVDGPGVMSLRGRFD